MLRPVGQLKRAPQKGALFAFWLLSLFWLPLQAQQCLPFQVDEWVEVAHVYDGDTVKLNDGRKLRFIGINSPEIGYDGEPSEPLANEARQALIDLLADNKRLALRFGAERKDRHGRLLAHVFLPDQRNVQLLLLRRGLAASVAVGQNLANIDCYLAAERQAGRQGVWRLPRFQGLATTSLPAGTKGFQVIQGKVVRVGESRKSYWLNFAGKVAARIDKSDLGVFENRLHLPGLQGKTIKLRGWLYPYKGQTQLRVYHPALIEVLE